MINAWMSKKIDMLPLHTCFKQLVRHRQMTFPSLLPSQKKCSRIIKHSILKFENNGSKSSKRQGVPLAVFAKMRNLKKSLNEISFLLKILIGRIECPIIWNNFFMWLIIKKHDIWVRNWKSVALRASIIFFYNDSVLKKNQTMQNMIQRFF